jgi:histidinol-phosphate/aromatic aminotransferase/cobyric acid decarboxylase-like protein
MQSERITPSPRRFVVLGGPGGYRTGRPVGCPMIRDRYRAWQPLFTVNRPLTATMANAAKDAVFRCYEIA